MERIRVIQGNIVRLEIDAIVTSSDNDLSGNGSVNGAIHRYAGQNLLKECHAYNGCQVGDAKLTGGYRLPSRHVIHTVAPVWQGGR